MRNNPELMRIIGIYGGIVILAIGIIAYLYHVVRIETGRGTDIISGETIDNYQGTESPGIDLIGLKQLQENGFSAQSYDSLCDKVKSYVRIVSPETTTISIVKDSLKKTDNSYVFRIKTDTKQEFTISADELSATDYKFAISNKYGELYHYDSSKFKKPLNRKETLVENFLPYSNQTADGDTFVFHYTLGGAYEIQVSSCGDANIKQQAEESVRTWLKSINYDPDEFTFTVPDYCNG